MEGCQVGGMYLLDMRTSLMVSSPNVGMVAVSAQSHETPVGIDIWHRQLGHASISTICEMSQKGLVEGLKVTGHLDVSGKYEDCILGKHVAHLYDEEVVPEKDMLERVYIDMWGPASVKSVGGASYLMVLVDSGSVMKFSYSLSHKTGNLMLQAFTEFHVAVKCVTGRKLLQV